MRHYLYAALICWSIALAGCVVGLSDIDLCMTDAASIPYVAEQDGRDVWQLPEDTWEHGGDCEDKALWLISCLEAKGYHPCLRTGNGHAWAELDGKKLDPTL